MSNENLQKQFLEDAPQAVDSLANVQDLSDCVVRLQRLEDEIKQDEENLAKGCLSFFLVMLFLAIVALGGCMLLMEYT